MVEAIGLSVRYRGGKLSQLSGIDFSIGRGVTAVIGRNGAGKTTLMRAITGLIPVSGGKISVCGHNPRDRRSRSAVNQRLGYLPQDFGYLSRFTVSEFVRYGAWLKGFQGSDASERSLQAIKRVDLETVSHTRMGQLSGGMRRRAGIAVTTVHDPDLLILDEPTAGLDPEQRIRFRELVKELADERTIILSSHMVEDVRVLADTVLVLEGGRLGFSGSPRQLELRAREDARGDSLLERGYISVISEMDVKC